VFAHGNAFAIWINQNLEAVKPVSVGCFAWTIDAVSVELPSHDSGYKDVPVMRSAIDRRIELCDSGRLLSVGVIEEQDLDLSGMG
jgi:hypothetical protein